MPLHFDPENLFPLLESIESTYENAKKHSAEVDQFLGFDVVRVEASIIAQNDTLPWAGLSPASLQTPYTEIRYMLSKLDLAPGQVVVDLGAAYGRMAHVIEAHHSGVQFQGYEVIEARACEGQRVMALRNLIRSSLVCVDVLDGTHAFPLADVYFVYDLSADLSSTERVLERLKNRAQDQSIQVVGRGRATRTMIERHHPWLSSVHQPRHFGNFSIYQS